jgi:hypothetical protein
VYPAPHFGICERGHHARLVNRHRAGQERLAAIRSRLDKVNLMAADGKTYGRGKPDIARPDN